MLISLTKKNGILEKTSQYTTERYEQKKVEKVIVFLQIYSRVLPNTGALFNYGKLN